MSSTTPSPRLSNEDLAILLDHIGEAIVALDGEYRVVYFNQAAVQLFGYRVEEILAHPLDQILPERFADILREHIRSSSQDRRELIARRKDGTEFPVEVGISTIAHDGAEFYVAIVADVAERKRAEEALRASEEKIHVLIEHSSEALLLVDAQGTMFFASSAVERILGHSKQERLGQSVLQFVHPDELEHASEIFFRLASEPGSIQMIECRLQHRDGTWRWVQVVGTNLLNVPAVRAIVINYRDITERKRTEDQIRFQASLLDQVTSGIAASDLDGTIIYWNHFAEVLHGWSAEQVLGKHYEDFLIPPSEVQRARELRQSLVSLGEAEIDLLLLKKDASRFPAHVNYAVMKDNHGEPIGFLGVSTDITERKKAEAKIQEQLERLTALREVDQAIASTFDVQASLDLLLSRAVQLLHVDAAAVLLFNPNQNVLEYGAGTGFRANAIQTARVKLGTGLAGRVALERQIVETRRVGNETNPAFPTDCLSAEGFVSYWGAPLVAKDKLIGVLEVFSRSFVERDRDWLDFFSTLAGQAAIVIDGAQLFHDLERSNAELSLAYDATIVGWSRALDLRDKETQGHTQRVTEMSLQLARRMNIPEEELVHIRRGALLHDIGKLGVPDYILLKAEALTELEWAIMKQHPILAYELLLPIPYLKGAAIDIPYCHHEHWDGSGYPRGLGGEQIPLAARLFAVVDVWDALCSNRPYRAAWTRAQASQYLRERAGKELDPQVVKTFLEMIGEEP